MDGRQNVKSEERESPSLSPSEDAHESASFLLSPPSPGTLDRLKAEEPMQEPLSSFSLHRELKTEPKTEDEPSPSQSPTVNDEFSPQKFKLSPSPTPPPSTTNGTASMSSTPPPAANPITTSKKAQASAVQLIGDLPIAREAALATFNEIEANNYQYKSLGRSREALESMTCDCTFGEAVDDPDHACGPDSDCINRLTQVECLPDDCRCRSHCRNQRFQNREYAYIDIVQTELKGFGLRAESFLPKDAFIYEYVGDVVSPVSFKKRMRDYAAEGIEHFYFMMLQKDEFIDATKSGGIGRFANHSCRPNCYVAKWTVDQHVRMGIFAKRDIKKHEELTFNYNVDRYGYVGFNLFQSIFVNEVFAFSHQAQTCYCGESNCVGFIGGKTQTDVATMDDLYLDALGITDEADLMELKGNKKKKGKKIDDPDFMPTMKPLIEKEIPKVVQAIRQTQSRKVLLKLLTRIKVGSTVQFINVSSLSDSGRQLTEDQAALRQIMRLRGYSLMTNVLDDHRSDVELIHLALSCMSRWPLLNRNKVDDSRVIVSARAIAESEDDKNKELAQTASLVLLVAHWEGLPLYNRIPKRIIKDGEATSDPTRRFIDEDENEFTYKRAKYGHGSEINLNRTRYRPKTRPFHRDSIMPSSFIAQITEAISEPPPQPRPPPVEYVPKGAFSRETIRAVVAAAAEAEAVAAHAAKEAEAAALAKAQAKAEAKAAAKAAKAEAAKAENGHRKKVKPPKKVHTEEEREALKEKRMLKLVGAVVVKSMSKHSKAMDHDQFKKHAKELTQIITDKEKKSSSYKEGRLNELSEEKVIKIKKFAKEYIAKVLRKLEKSGKRGESSSNAATASTSTLQDAPSHEHGGDDVVMGDASMEDMNVASDSDGDADGDADEDLEDETIADGDGTKAVGIESPRSPIEESVIAEPWGIMDLDEGAVVLDADIQPPSDPRRRPPNSQFDSWEPPQGPSGM
ncbi:hypothetical protein DXG01_001787 [Tephrocybe rancida]|nr:hypothetical protein DXG01_001787 [Tephrocybe rancida]